MPTCSEFRARARKNLGGNIFANAWLFTLLAILINGAILSFTSISIIGAILLYGPMTYGLAKFMLLITRSEGKKTDLATLFNGFTDDFGGTLCLGLLTSSCGRCCSSSPASSRLIRMLWLSSSRSTIPNTRQPSALPQAAK